MINRKYGELVGGWNTGDIRVVMALVFRKTLEKTGIPYPKMLSFP